MDGSMHYIQHFYNYNYIYIYIYIHTYIYIHIKGVGGPSVAGEKEALEAAGKYYKQGEGHATSPCDTQRS